MIRLDLRGAALLGAMLFSCSLGRAQTSYPMLMSLQPAAAQIGQTSEHVLTARNSLTGATSVLVTGEGVTGEVVPPEVKPGETPPASDRIKVRFTVGPDALPGVRDFRLATPTGATTVGQLVIVRDPVVAEDAGNNNDALAGAQVVTLPATICGIIEKAEDVDHYKFHAEAGQALTFSMQCMRLEDRLHDMQVRADPILTLKNASGTVLEQVDNYFAGDPLLHYAFSAAGDYLLEIRDVRYQGNPYWIYSLEINDRPYLLNPYPLGVAPGVENRLELVGYQVPPGQQAILALPADAAEGSRKVVLPLGIVPPNPVSVYVSRLPLIAEAAAENDLPAGAQIVALPCGVNGRIEKPSDTDCYAFDAKKDEHFSFEVVARRLQSGLDPNVRILNAEGAALAENDDLTSGRFSSADSQLENWTAPADGRYIVEVRDLHLRGGDRFAYFLQCTRSQPYFSLELDTDKTQLAPGTSGVIFVRCYRKNGFAGEVQLAIEGLPQGVSAACGRILAEGNDGAIMLTAAANAPLGVGNVRVTGTASHANADGSLLPLAAVAQPLQEYYSPGGGRGNFPVDVHTVSVAPPQDIVSVKVTPLEITLKPGESQKIEIAIQRREGFDKNVTLDCIYRHLEQPFGMNLPKGVTIDDTASKTLLTGMESQGHIVLKAAPDAKPVDKHLLAMMAHVSLNFVVKATYCGDPVYVSVAGTEAGK